MTLSTTTNRQDFTVSGIGPYTFARKVFDATTIQVWTIDANGLKGAQANFNVDYFVSVASGNASADVTLSSAYAAAQDGNDIMVLRVLPFEQTLDLQVNNTLNEEFLESALDEQVMRMQQLDEDFGQIDSRFTDFETNTVTQVEADLAKAKQWATEVEDTPVETGPDQFSALHHAAKAEASATNIAASETAAAASASAASDSADAASTSETNAATSEAKAGEWADKAEDDPVETGPDRFSAFHWAQKAQDFASGSASTISYDPAGSTIITGTDVQAALDQVDTDLVTARPVARGGTGQTTAAAAFNALKQTATESASGVVELATTAEIYGAVAGAKALTAEDLATAADVVVLNDASTIGIDWNDFIHAKVVISGNRTIDNPVNVQEGVGRILVITQNTGGGHTLAWGSNYWFPDDGVPPTIAATEYSRSVFLLWPEEVTKIHVFTLGLGMRPNQ